MSDTTIELNTTIELLKYLLGEIEAKRCDDNPRSNKAAYNAAVTIGAELGISPPDSDPDDIGTSH